MILYGWNHYRLRSVEPHEIGIYDPELSNLRFEYRQKYFHLFFIPFFPIGRFWGVNRGGKLFDTTAEVESALRQLPTKTKNGVWAWSGLLSIAAAILIFNVSQTISEQEYSNRLQSNAALLSGFFQDKKKIDPLFKKMESVNYIVDSALEVDEFEDKKIDTSETALFKLIVNIKLTQTDSLTGYTNENTFVVKHLHNVTNSDDNKVLSRDHQAALTTGKWEGSAYDTSDVFREMRKLENYKYVLVVKEYNRLDPEVYEGGYNPGYSLAHAAIIDIASKKVIKKFDVIASNSDRVRKMQMGSSEPSPADWIRTLHQDLNKNLIQRTVQYVFGEYDPTNTGY